MAEIRPAQVYQIGAELRGDGDQIHRFGAGVARAGSLFATALSGTPVAGLARTAGTGATRLCAAVDAYHDYLAAFGGSLDRAAALYEETDDRSGRAIGLEGNEIGPGSGRFHGFSG